MKLHLGCGDMILPGWVNCDLYDSHADLVCDVRRLPFRSDSVDEIYSAHVIEHFDFYEAFEVLGEWKRVLKQDGRLAVETPDFIALCKTLPDVPESDRPKYCDHFFGKPWIPGLGHKFLYAEGQLGWTLGLLGFRNIVRAPAKRYWGIEHLCLKMECVK